jgi:glycosyltransferase involved in cell wall biosynthesis
MSFEVSVIIPSYNSAAYLPEAIESALGQTVPPLEVIVVNDGSTDGTARILDQYRGRIRSIFQENRGLSAARNRGIAAARGDLIAFLDADDIWLPEKLEQQLACLAMHPRAGLVHTDIFWWDERTGTKSRRDAEGNEFVGRCSQSLFFRSRVTPSTMLVRGECLAQVGDFDEAIRRPTTQDYDLLFRITRYYELAYVAEPLILYRLHGSNFSKQVRAMEEDTLYVLRKVLRADPDLGKALGRRVVHERLFDLSFSIGYQYHDAGQSTEARRYLLQALRHRPLSAATWLLYLANLLPPRRVRGLRRLGSSLASARRRRLGRIESISGAPATGPRPGSTRASEVLRP